MKKSKKCYYLLVILKFQMNSNSLFSIANKKGIRIESKKTSDH